MRTSRRPTAPRPAAVAEPPERELCGYRILRRVHTGERTHAYLASAENGTTVVVRIFHGTGADEKAAGELALDDAVASPHLARTHDVGASATDSPVLVCERLGHRLSTLLERDGMIAAGSVVTLLAPLVAVCGQLQSAGFAHGTVNPAHVRFADDGRPVLTGADGGVPATRESQRLDLRGIADIAAAVFARTDPETRARGMRNIVDWIGTAVDAVDTIDESFYADLECRVFALADPLPFAVAELPPPDTPEQALRRERVAHDDDEPSGVIGSLLEGELTFSLDAIRALARRAGRLLGRAAPRWRLIAAGAVVFGAAVTAGLLLLPGDAQAKAGPSTQSVERAAAPPPSAAVTDARAALTALLASRAECWERRDPTCLAAVYSSDSPMGAADRRALETGSADPAPVLSLAPERRELRDPQPHGAVVIVSVEDVEGECEPASVLLLETEAGWIIRDVFVG